jgi:beta-glucoside operon transcriptional antiterminator
MRNIRKYNNNIILAEDKGQEVIVLGKGIGFQTVPGMEIDNSMVEKVFIPQETVHINRFADTLSTLAYEYVLLASKIVDYGKEELFLKLNPSILVALADHLSAAFTRLDKQMDIQSLLQWEIQHIYPKEYKAGIQALEIIRQNRYVRFPEPEAICIALHFINAEMESQNMSTTFKIVTITGYIMRVIEDYFNMILNRESLEFMRLINHVRDMILEYVTDPPAGQNSREDDELYSFVMNRQKRVSECCEHIRSWLREQHEINLRKNDVTFLAMHINKITEQF